MYSVFEMFLLRYVCPVYTLVDVQLRAPSAAVGSAGLRGRGLGVLAPARRALSTSSLLPSEVISTSIDPSRVAAQPGREYRR